MIGLSQSWFHVLAARSADRFGKGIRTSPRDALLSDSAHPDERGASFGWHRGLDTVGAAIGPLLALVFLEVMKNDLRKIYFYALFPGLLAAFLVLTIKDKKIPPPPISKTVLKAEAIANVWHSKGVKRFLLSWGIFSITSFSDVFLILKTKESGVTLSHTILLYCFYNVFYASLSPYLGHLSDKLGRKKILFYGLLLFAAVYAGFGFATRESHYWILFAIYGIFMAATEGASKAYVVDLAPPHLKATGIGLLNTVIGFCSLGAGVICGLLWDHFGSLSCFLYGAIGALIAASIIHYEFASKPS